MTATDPDDSDMVTYSITGGNEAGKFAVGANTGEITVVGALNRETVSSYTLTVVASDGRGGTATSSVFITVIEASCSNGVAVPDPGVNAGLVGDCATLMAIMDTLVGTGTLNWRLDRAVISWDGVIIGGTPSRVTRLELRNRGLSGVVPAGLADLTGLAGLDLAHNRLTGQIPGRLGELTSLTTLDLSFNQLSGPIPRELGNLSQLVGLWLNENADLTGEIPSELGRLSRLEGLWLSGNDLSGMIPEELGGLSNLLELWLNDNRMSGPIPSEFVGLTAIEILVLNDNELSGPVLLGTG